MQISRQEVDKAISQKIAIQKQLAANKLTAKQRTLAQMYAYTNNIIKSAKTLKYSKPWQYTVLLQNATFVEYVSILRKQMIQQYIAQSEYAVMIYKESIDMARKNNDYAAMSSIASNIAKMREPVQSIKGKVQIQII